MKKSALLRGLGFLVLVAAAGTGLIALSLPRYRVPLIDWAQVHRTQYLDGVEALGLWAPVVFAAVYAVACLVIPGTLITLVVGFTFGVVLGTVIVSAGSVTGASLAFWLGRTLARGWVEGKVAGSPRFRAIDQAVAAQGFKIVLLTRLSPAFPFTLLNYAFGLTKVRFRDYFFASWVGMLPGTVLYVYLGSALKSFADLAAGKVEGGPASKVLFYAGLAATALVTVYVTHLARRALRRAVPDAEPVPAPPAEGVPHA
jgi:uncharacterized membrane protein YdjX (TVP38/TMEM64 family)